MFYCDSCADRFGYPRTAFRSSGRCECCGEGAVCNEMPSSALPLPKAEDPNHGNIICPDPYCRVCKDETGEVRDGWD